MNHPITSYNNITSGWLQIDGCTYKSLIPLNQNDQVFYLVNGVTKHVILDVKFVEKSDTGPFYSFTPYLKNETSVEDQGFYQCVIAIHGPLARTILSKTADVQFLGFILFYDKFFL